MYLLVPGAVLFKRQPQQLLLGELYNSRPVQQMIRIMKLMAFFLLFFSLHISARTTAQKVTISGKNLNLRQVCEIIKSQTGYEFMLDNALVAKSGVFNMEVKNADLKQVLDKYLPGRELAYSIQQHVIVIYRNEKNSKTHLLADSAVAQLLQAVPFIELEGQVTDTAGRPLANAYVILEGTKKRTITNSNGMFTLKDAPARGSILVTIVGYENQTVAYAGPELTIKMKQAVSELDAINIVAYGTTTRRFTTGAIAKVSEEDIQKSPAANPMLSLEGRMPGVYITEGSGVSGAAFNINIRGINSINAGKLPLYIIDGVAFEGKATEQSVGSFVSSPSTIGSAGFNPLNVLSPDMIESIEVLKDADATALYGSRAANGVVLITTKKAKAGNSKLNAHLYSGQSTVTRTLPMLNADQYIAMRKQAFANDGTTPTASNAPDLMSFAAGWNTDMQQYFFNTGHFTDATVDVSGGSAETQFLLSGTYRYESPVFTGDFTDKIGRMKLGIQHTSKDKRLKLNASVNYSIEKNVVPVFNLYNVYNLAPNLPLYNTNGSLAWYTGYTNPVSTMINSQEQSNRDLLGNFTVSYQIMKGLSFKTDAGYHRAEVQNIYAVFRKGSSTSSTVGVEYNNQSNISLYNIEPQLNYSTHIGMGQLQALAGATYQYNNAVQPIFFLGTFTSDALYKDPGSVTFLSKSSSSLERKYVSLFGRLNYTWDNKYIINGNFRRDGSSSFAPGSRFGNFGSIGAAWIASEERFLKNNLTWLSFLKLRTSYGSIGNDQLTNPYGYLSYYGSSSAYGSATSLYPVTLANNSNFSWETTKKLDIAADFGFFKDRILLTAGWYHNMTSNMLLSSVPIGSQSGFTGYTGNVPGLKVQNNGVELELTATPVKTASFTWKTAFNIAANKNKVVSFPGLASSSFAKGGLYNTGTTMAFVIGQPINLLYGYEFTGFKNGVATVKDVNSDGSISEGLYANGKGDWVSFGTSDPKYYGGFNNSFSYKGFQLDILFQFVKKKNFNIYHGMTVAPGGNANMPADILNKPEIKYTASSSSAIYSSFVNYYAKSDASISDASYIRLKNVSLTYSLPKQWLRNIHMQTASVYVRGQNLLTFTKYLGFDPESFGSTMPLYKMIMIGINTTL